MELPDQDEVNLRREWRQYEYENNKFREAIKNCKTGPKDFDCSVKDYIASEQDFKEYVDQDDVAIEDDYRIITLIDYDDLLRSDVRG